jgi:ComF family protein
VSILSRLLEYFYPPICLACGGSFRSGGEPLLCPRCMERLIPLSPVRCPVCAIPFASAAALSHYPDHRCGECRETPPFFSRTLIPFAYEGPLIKAIQSFKYKKKAALARPLSRLLIRGIGDLHGPPSVDVVVPIPLHPDRLREREFNQAALLARPLAAHLKIPFMIDLLDRVLPTPQQVGLNKEERAKNVRRAFSVRGSDRIAGTRVLLVDDVFTTGATLNEAAKVLKKKGAKEVVACALARMI